MFAVTRRHRLLPVLMIATVFLASACQAGPAASVNPSAAQSLEPTPTATATATPEPTAEPTAAATPTPTPTSDDPPTVGPYLAYGLRATVAVDSLTMRSWPGVDQLRVGSIPRDGELLLDLGPVEADGYRWYEAIVMAPEALAGTSGVWVAAEPAAGGDPLLTISEPMCPASVDTPTLARLTALAIDLCDVQVASVQGLVDLCYHGPGTELRLTPYWVYQWCLYLRNADDPPQWLLPVAFPPDLTDPLPERGDVVKLSGRIGFDESVYGPCTVTASAPEYEEGAARQRPIWALTCQTRFVVSGVDVVDHIELPPH